MDTRNTVFYRAYYFLSKCAEHVENKRYEQKEKYFTEAFSETGGTRGRKLEVGFIPRHLYAQTALVICEPCVNHLLYAMCMTTLQPEILCQSVSSFKRQPKFLLVQWSSSKRTNDDCCLSFSVDEIHLARSFLHNTETEQEIFFRIFRLQTTLVHSFNLCSESRHV